MELEIVRQWQGYVIGSPIGMATAVFAARYLIAVYFVLAAFLYYSRRKRERHAAKEALWAVLFALLITNIIGFFVQRLRPYRASWIAGVPVPILIPPPLTTSFPSGHAAVSFALAFAIYWGDKKLGAIAFVIAAVISLARILVGVHYPSDVFAGAAVGYAGFALIRFLHQRFGAATR